MKIKRDLTSTSAPAPNQLEVGELAINANTGILYAKMANGTVIKWLGVPVCETSDQTVCPVPVPEIMFSDVTNFCCGGDSLTVYVSNLLVNHRYVCIATDLVSNSTTSITTNSISLLPLNKSDRSAVFNININKSLQSQAVLKISIYEIISVNNLDTQMLRSEQLINICCNNCTS